MNDFRCLGADIADILGHKDTKVISDDNLAALVRQIAVNCDVCCFFSQFLLSFLTKNFVLSHIFALMLHEYCQCVTILCHYQTSCEVLHKLNKIILQIRRDMPFIFLVLKKMNWEIWMLLINATVFEDYDWHFDLLTACLPGSTEAAVPASGSLRLKLVGATSSDQAPEGQGHQ